MSTAEENKAQFRRFYEEGLNRGNLAVADEVVDPECIDHEAHPGGDRGPESMRALIRMLPTGRSVQQNSMHFVRFRDGKAIEHWEVRDDLSMMRQLGVIPSAEQISAEPSEEASLT